MAHRTPLFLPLPANGGDFKTGVKPKSGYYPGVSNLLMGFFQGPAFPVNNFSKAGLFGIAGHVSLGSAVLLTTYSFGRFAAVIGAILLLFAAVTLVNSEKKWSGSLPLMSKVGPWIIVGSLGPLSQSVLIPLPIGTSSESLIFWLAFFMIASFGTASMFTHRASNGQRVFLWGSGLGLLFFWYNVIIGRFGTSDLSMPFYVFGIIHFIVGLTLVGFSGDWWGLKPEFSHKTSTKTVYKTSSGSSDVAGLPQDELEKLLDERLIKGEISEDTYNRLQAKYIHKKAMVPEGGPKKD